MRRAKPDSRLEVYLARMSSYQRVLMLRWVRLYMIQLLAGWVGCIVWLYGSERRETAVAGACFSLLVPYIIWLNHVMKKPAAKTTE